jgi:hypothetical protein
MMGTLLGGVLVLVAIILFAVQHFNVYNFYGDVSNKWYFYGLIGIIGIIGVVLAAWYYSKK